MKKKLVVIRGAGELATGIAHRLHNTGYSVLMLEKEAPSAIRRSVVFAEAVYDGEKRVERVTCYKANNLHEAEKLLKKGVFSFMAYLLATTTAFVIVIAMHIQHRSRHHRRKKRQIGCL